MPCFVPFPWYVIKQFLSKTGKISPPWLFIQHGVQVKKVRYLYSSYRSHSFSFAPYATVFDLRSQMNSKFNITSDLYWLSNRGKPLHDFVSLKEISGAVIMNGRLTGGAKCYFRGVKMMQVHANLTASLEDMKLSVALKTLLGTWKMLKI